VQNKLLLFPIHAIHLVTVPCNLSEFLAFLSLVGYYRQYIPGFAGVAQPLNRLTAKKTREAAGIRPPQEMANGGANFGVS